MSVLGSTRATVQVGGPSAVSESFDSEGRILLAVAMIDGAEGATPVPGAEYLLEGSGRVGSVDMSELFAQATLTRRGFIATEGATLVVDHLDGISVALIGVGSGEEPTQWRSLGAKVVSLADGMVDQPANAGEVASGGLPVTAGPIQVLVALGTHPGAVRAVRAVAEGVMLSSYRFEVHKSEVPPAVVDAVTLVVPQGAVESSLFELATAAVVAGAVCLARDLVNEPAGHLSPVRMAEIFEQSVADENSISVEVWDKARIEAERLGGLLCVAQGSVREPRLVVASYEPTEPVQVDGKVPHLVVVGKGITFDSGGLSLKSGTGMMSMKTDMGGAAAALSALSACPGLGVAIRVTAITPLAENMPSGTATRPGDVLTIRDGQTIEVLNTDAEGRLVLADGLVLANEMDPDAIVDLATLTGACVVALGGSIGGLFSNDAELSDEVLAAGLRAGEKLWPMPLEDDYKSHIESDIADMKNIGKEGQAGSISAALLLARFVGGTPWVHLDIAGPARSDEAKGLITKGGTGFGVRTLLELFGSFPDRAG